MSYANYSAATGLPLVQPNQTETFRQHTHRDKVVDNKKVIRKVRVAKGAVIRSERTYATAILAGIPPTAEVSMPYTGLLNLTVMGAGAGDLVYINNPFVSGLASQPIAINNGPDPTATVSSSPTMPGQLTLSLTAGVDGVYVISVRN